ERRAQRRQAPPGVGAPLEGRGREREHVVAHRAQLGEVARIVVRLHGAHDRHVADPGERPQQVIGTQVAPDVGRQRHVGDQEEGPHRGAVGVAGVWAGGADGDADGVAVAASGTSAADRNTMSQKSRCASAETKKPAARNAVRPTSSASAVRVTSSGFVARARRIRSRLAYVATIVARSNTIPGTPVSAMTSMNVLWATWCSSRSANRPSRGLKLPGPMPVSKWDWNIRRPAHARSARCWAA